MVHQHVNSRKGAFWHFHCTHLLTVCVLALFVVTLSACSGSITPSANVTTAPPSAIVATRTSQTIAVTTAQTATSFPVKVFFSKFPDSVNTNFAAVFPVNRVSPTSAVGTFAIQLLIAGPTLDERNAGYFSELNSMLGGASNCSAPHPIGGPDFTLTLNKKGTQNEKGTATLQFCRVTSSAGIGADARVQAQINATLKQFSSIQKVVILTQSGSCFGDESGQNHCLL